MNKEGKDRGNKGEKDMQAIVKKTVPSFADFVNSNKNGIRKAVGSNSTQNSDGLTVISKDDPWRDESEWDQLEKDFKDK
jgi:hypothetical protein